ncbi:MAG: PfkB family carbohydrate kinase, partial [Chloroflexota bacterium]
TCRLWKYAPPKDLKTMPSRSTFDRRLVTTTVRNRSRSSSPRSYQIVEIRNSPGAAGNVVSNLRALELDVSVLGVVGQDGLGFDLQKALLNYGANVSNLLEDPNRFTPTYTKPMRQVNQTRQQPDQELNRFDLKNRAPLPALYETKIIERLKKLVPTVDGVIIADQVQERNCGVITDNIRATLAQLSIAYPDKIFIADSRTRIAEFEHLIIKPNLDEALHAIATIAPDQDQTILTEATLVRAKRYGQLLFQKQNIPVFITLGSEGILGITEEGDFHIPGIPVKAPIDIVGAGDTVMAALASALCAGATYKEAATLGNIAASLTIQQLGTTGTVSQQQLRQSII